jgi:hypothetical protein
MDFLQMLGEWIAENETLLSGVAALVAVVGVVVSPIVVLIRRGGKGDSGTNAKSSSSIESAAGGSATEKLSYRDLIQPSPFPVQFANSNGVRIAYNVRGDSELLTDRRLSHRNPGTQPGFDT